MSNQYESALTYTSYLQVDELLKLQKPLSDGPEHDELLFIVIHQTYELWFKQLLHEFSAAGKAMEAGDTHYALALLGRIRTIMKVCVAQIDATSIQRFPWLSFIVQWFSICTIS